MPERRDPVERLGLRGRQRRRRRPDAVGPEREAAAGGDGAVELAEAAGGAVARVGDGLLARGDERLVELLEGAALHVGLAADLDGLWRRGLWRRRRASRGARGEAERDLPDGAHVARHVLAGGAVAARGGAHEAAVLVRQREGQAVDLELDLQRGPLVVLDHALQPFEHPVVPRAEFARVEGVAEREQRDGVADLLERLQRCAADAVRRAVRRRDLGVRGLEVLERAEEPVVLGVADGALALGVVRARQPAHDLAELRHQRQQVLGRQVLARQRRAGLGQGVEAGEEVEGAWGQRHAATGSGRWSALPGRARRRRRRPRERGSRGAPGRPGG